MHAKITWGCSHLDAKQFKIRPQIREITATSGSSNSIDTDVIQKPLDCHLNFRKCTQDLNISRVATLIFGENKMAGRTMISAKRMASGCLFMHRWLWFGNSTTRFCNAMSNFDKCHYIHCLRAEFATKYAKALSSLTTRWKMEPDCGSWQSPDISRSHLYCGTIAWTSPTTIYREYTVRPQICEITAMSDSSDSIDTDLTQKLLDFHLNFRKCTLTVEYITVLRAATLIFGEYKMAGGTMISAKYTCIWLSLVFHIAIPKTSNISCTQSFDLLTNEFSKRVSIIRRILY